MASLAAHSPSTISERERLLAFSFANADMLVEADGGLVVRYASGATRSLAGWGEADMVGRNLLELFPGADRLLIANVLNGLGDNARLDPVAVRIQGRLEQPRPATLSGYRMDDGVPHYFLTVSKARLSAKEQAAALRADVETGLMGTQDFADIVADRSAAAREIDADTTLTMVQFDELEKFKGRVGASNAALLMSEVGAALRALSIGGATAGRLASDKFGVLHGAGVEGGEVRRKLEAIGRSCDPTGQGLAVGGSSINLGHTELTAEDSSRVVMYTIRRFAEEGGKDFNISSMAEGVQQMLGDTVAKVSVLKDTVMNQRIDMALQPIVGLSDRQVHHYEALCRPRDGASPAAFVGFAEQIGMVDDFDLMVSQKIIGVMLEAQRNGAHPQIAVNLSAVSLENDLFVGAFRKLLEPYANLRPDFLIEVTESTHIRDLARAENVLRQLREDGHLICLDDFGAGAAAFQYIQALTVNFVKIDGAYVRRMLGDGRDEAILRAMASLCRDLKVGTIAEMIETQAQVDRLLALGVGFGQGYLFGKPRTDYQFSPPAKPRNVRRQGSVESWS